MEKQIIELQEMFAHQQADIAKMSDELYAQQKEIAELKRQVKRLNEQLNEMAHSQGNDAPEPPPPHY